MMNLIFVVACNNGLRSVMSVKLLSSSLCSYMLEKKRLIEISFADKRYGRIFFVR